MKKMRRFAAIAAAAAMTACMAMPMMTAWAVEVTTEVTSGSITINNSATGHIYEAYQIFDGDLTKTTETDNNTYKYTFSNIEWGTNVAANEKLYTDLQTANAAFNGVTTVDGVVNVLKKITAENDPVTKAFASVIENYITGDPVTFTPGTGQYTAVVNDPGYYLVKDQDGSQAGNDDSHTRYILKVFGEETVTPKGTTPEVMKKVKENTDGFDTISNAVTFPGDKSYTLEDGYNDIADYSVGDMVEFMLYGSMPTTIGDYKKYRYTFHDTLASQFAFDASSVVVNIDGTPVQGYTVVTENLEDGETFNIVFEDIKAAATVDEDSIVTVYYKAELTENAVIGLDGQMNTVYLEYSNNPNWNGEPTVKDENNEDKPNPDDSTGETPEDSVIVFTYELDVTKVDGSNTEVTLSGAEFVLKNSDGAYAMVDASGRFRGWSTDRIDTATEKTINGDTVSVTTKLTSGTGGLFTVSGIDEGTYYLEETKAPTNYNILQEDVEVEVKANTRDKEYTPEGGTATSTDRQGWETNTASDALIQLEISVNNGTAKAGDIDNGIVEAQVENNKGSSLPSTGGIGTTLFYVIGGTLAAGAGVGLIAKKRMKNEE